ncbi:MAG: hypothetical protein Q9O62_07165 [Ardenticatenia bacterium]|nr:hypothetical protein [Ardenticatenia bacterium]
MAGLREWLNALLGRGIGPVESKSDRLFAINTALVTMEVSVNLRPTGMAALAFKGLEAAQFNRIRDEVRQLLEIARQEADTRVGLAVDEYGYHWVVLRDPDFEDLVTALHLVTSTLEEQGFGKTLLAAVFQFQDERERTVYWIYNFKRGRYYPFVPRGKRERNHAYELQLKAVMAGELPVEPELERWYPLWDIPEAV